MENTNNGEVSGLTTFNYFQEDNIIWAEYYGGDILKGFLIGKVDENSNLSFHYQHINRKLETRIGKCISKPEILDNNKLIMHEEWQWLNGDMSKGKSILKEL